MSIEIGAFSDYLEEQAARVSECFPVDRYFLKEYLDQIFTFDKKEFIFSNLERGSNTYTVQLFLCLPELWDEIELNDLLEMTKRFTNIFSFYTLIEFTHKYLEINIIESLLKLSSISLEVKQNIVNYLQGSWFPNLIKSEGDFLFFRENIYGVELSRLAAAKEHFLLDRRIKSANTSLEEMRTYVKEIGFRSCL